MGIEYAGMDKTRAENGVLVWDIKRSLHLSSDSAAQPCRPIIELGLSETTHSLDWLGPKSLICGINNKHLKIFDLRDDAVCYNGIPMGYPNRFCCADGTKHQSTASTKAVYEIAVDPMNENRWKMNISERFLLDSSQPQMVTLTEAKPIVKISWCPTRSNLLSCLTKDSSVIKLYDMKQVPTGPDEMEPAIMERTIEPLCGAICSSYSWHPTDESRLLAVSETNDITDYTVEDRITLNWSAGSHLVWTHGKKTLFSCSPAELPEAEDNIALQMHRRALLRYGLESPANNAKIVHDVPELTEKEKHPEQPGFRGILSLVEEGSPSHSAVPSDHFVVYVSQAREQASQLCGWGSQKDCSTLQSLLHRLQNKKQYTRAAALAVFNLDLRKAIAILNFGHDDHPDSHLNVTAMALAGYTPDKMSLWKEMCSSLKSQLTDPYIQSIFSFLTADTGAYDEILSNQHICIQDRIAFACLYLNDQKLLEYLRNLSSILIGQGNLEAILLTGLNGDGLSLLQQYLDLSGDVQTVSAVVLHTVPACQDPRPQAWVEHYRQLLDCWELWVLRCEFDILWWQGCPAQHPGQQVFVSCTFCGKSVSHYLKLVNPQRATPANSLGQHLLYQAALKNKVSCCPACRKPMPRCALCLGRMGTHSGLLWSRGHPPATTQTSDLDSKLTRVASWFTWCQTCRHGGHAQHLLDWFKVHSNCPVASCQCKCLSLDDQEIPSNISIEAISVIINWFHSRYQQVTSK
ncbi:MIOS [Cordylochernes scorpioides]|uniref:MIOS n=1 Tax=Cordylochernes scorpioides TaxID=51811 RepID=A0ABY6KEY7_9ARAC|nr:MIOS [Cordylochernes scorpioides]